MADEQANSLVGLTAAAIADALGDIDAIVEPLLERRTQLRGEMTRRRLKSAAGERWRVDRTVTSPLVADVAAIQVRMGETWMQAFRRPQVRIGFTIVRRTTK